MPGSCVAASQRYILGASTGIGMRATAPTEYSIVTSTKLVATIQAVYLGPSPRETCETERSEQADSQLDDHAEARGCAKSTEGRHVLPEQREDVAVQAARCVRGEERRGAINHRGG